MIYLTKDYLKKPATIPDKEKKERKCIIRIRSRLRETKLIKEIQNQEAGMFSASTNPIQLPGGLKRIRV